ncbi:MAG: hypothetical protein H6Q44_2388, partial [Deltaproteobacteria bacterium]|nr:hypothetical protein [Deltaproteobacteria bacterium]
RLLFCPGNKETGLNDQLMGDESQLLNPPNPPLGGEGEFSWFADIAQGMKIRYKRFALQILPHT